MGRSTRISAPVDKVLVLRLVSRIDAFINTSSSVVSLLPVFKGVEGSWVMHINRYYSIFGSCKVPI